ncbi:MAG: hypothetical protein ACXV5H_09725 [Halobacteriota archaeon]
MTPIPPIFTVNMGMFTAVHILGARMGPVSGATIRTKFTEVSVISSPTEYEPPWVLAMSNGPNYPYCKYGTSF